MASEIELRKRFNDFFQNEDPWNKLDSCRDKLYKLKVIKFLKLSGYGNVLDLGCGEGDFTYLISKYVDSIDAVDISDKAIKRAKSKYSTSNIHYYSMGALEFCTPPHNKQYDLILSLEMLYYLDDNKKAKLLESIRNILKENGILYIGLVVSGQNKYGKYFTFESATELLSRYFKIIQVSSVVPRSFKTIPVRKLFIKTLCFFKQYNFAVKFIESFIEPSKDAYQVNFVCIKKNK